MRSSKYNAALLAPIVRSSRTFSDVLRRLGLPVNGGNFRHIAARVRQAGLDTSHFGTTTIAARCAAVPIEALTTLVPRCTSIAQVLIELQMPPEGRSHREIKRRIRQLGIDTSHLRGQGWSRGETSRSHPSVAQGAKNKTWPDDEVFVANSPLVEGRSVTRRLLAMGWSYRCTWCEITEWRGKPLVLHLDHINGTNNDNRLVNLRFLCANCHSQTDTYSNRRR